MKFWYVATLGFVFAPVPGKASEPAARKLTSSLVTQRFAHGRVIAAPPIAERSSPFRHKRILKAFANGAIGALRAQQAEQDQVRQVFGSEVINRLPTVEKLRTFQQVTQADTVIFTLLRFLPRDQVIAEIWAFSHDRLEPVQIAATEIVHKEARGSLYMVAAPINNSVVEDTSWGWIPTTPQQHALVKIHPNLNSGGYVSGLSPEEAERDFDFIGSSLGHQAREYFDKVWRGNHGSFVVSDGVSLSKRDFGNTQKFVPQSNLFRERFWTHQLSLLPRAGVINSDFAISKPQKTASR